MNTPQEKNDFESFLETLRILYVEDEDSIRTTLSRTLLRYFPFMQAAQNGRDGLDKFNSFKPDIVITDIKMPVMDGLSMLREVKKKNQCIPCIVATAFGDAEYMLDAIKIGFPIFF